MASFKTFVAEVAHQRHLIVFQELWRFVFLAKEKLFTQLAPSLKVGRITAILNKSHHLVSCIEHVPTDNCRGTLTVRTHDCERSEAELV